MFDAAYARSLYVHWPFCRGKCAYCPFVSVVGQSETVQRYYRALAREIHGWIDQMPGPRSLETVYLGGGTPSLCPPELLLDMFAILKRNFLFENKCEVSIEINPGTVTPELLRTWRDAGINRASIGVQTIFDEVLARLNRRQTVAQVRDLMAAIPSFFDNVSVDIIVGLPGVSTPMWRTCMSELVAWPVQHVSMYFLTLHESTPLYQWVQGGATKLLDDDEVVDQYEWAVEFLARHGFCRYEVSNFARPGYECRHNQVYWQRLPFKGVGVAAWSFDGLARLCNEMTIEAYVEAVEAKNHAVLVRQQLTSDQVWDETLMLGLRQACGVSYPQLVADLDSNKRACFDESIEQLKEQKLIRADGGRLKLTNAGMLVEQEVTVALSRSVS